MEFITDHLDQIVGLRKKNPDLHKELENFVMFINEKLCECTNTWEVMKKAEEIDYNKVSVIRLDNRTGKTE